MSMTDDKKIPPHEGSKPAGNGNTNNPFAGDDVGQHGDLPPDTDEFLGEPTPKHHDDIIAEQRREISDLKDRILRAHAEVDNIRKRTEQEKKDTAKYAVTRFAHDIVNVGDNFQRAIQAVPSGAADNDPALQSLIEGVMVTEREFLNVLERHGVKRVDPKGEMFNPHLHQAVMQQPSADVAPSTVLQVFQSGFTIEDRVLRPAMVSVSTEVAKPTPPPMPSEPIAAATPSPAPSPTPSGPAETAHRSDGQTFGRRTTPPGGGESG